MRMRFAVAVILGGGIGVGQAPLSLTIVSLLALLLTVAAFTIFENWKSAAWFGWAVGIGYFGSTLFWIVEPFFVEPERHGWMAPFALGFMVGGIALFWALGFGLAAAMGQTKSQRLFGLIVGLGLAELLRSYVFTGFPWGLLGYIWLDTPLAQLAAIFGPHGLGAFTIGAVVLPFLFTKRLVGLGLAALLVLSGWGFGTFQLRDSEQPSETTVRLRLIQPNAPQNQKWDPQFAAGFFQRQLALTATASEKPLDLVIWPEAAITFWLDSEPELQRKIVEAAPGGAKVILGARRIEGQRFYNSLALLGETGQSEYVYDKTHLVPFGEYIPFGSWLSRFGIYGMAAEEGGGFTAGGSHGLMDLAAAGKVLPLICYEAIFPHLTRSESRPDWILQLTNDAWFGQLAGPQQHLAQARMRAIEQGLPLARAANTGVSAVIDANGNIVASLGLGVSGALDVDLPKAKNATLYSKTGDWGMLIVLLLGFASLLTIRMRN